MGFNKAPTPRLFLAGWAAVSLVCGLIGILAFGCTKQAPEKPVPETEESEEEPELIVQPVQAVCLFDDLSFWAGPSTKTGYLNYEIKKGEAVTWLGKTATEEDDDRKREYLNIRLTDGSEGWALAGFIAVDAEPAALIEEASIYRKNNLISKTDLNYEPMDIVAVLEKQEEWIKVRGSWNTPEYWIKPGNLTYAEVDIAVAYQYLKAQEEPDDTARRQRLVQDILEEAAFTDSIFAPRIQAEVQEILDQEAEALEEAKKAEAEAGEQEKPPVEDREGPAPEGARE